jgi:hypothetical protein
VLREDFGSGSEDIMSVVHRRILMRDSPEMQVVTYLHGRFHNCASERRLGEHP